MGSQFWIKVILIASFVVLTLIVVIPRRGARPIAIRRLTMILLLVTAVAAVAFPDWTNSVARLVGVGRGTDLLLYALAVVFVGHTIRARTSQLASEQNVTELARKIALLTAPPHRDHEDGERQD